jgi:tRNA pseudouridine38-40 synthase
MQARLTVEYDGTNYCGWQFQPNRDSIQSRLEAALETIFNTAVRVRGAGRTDAGVHALGQVAAARLPRPFAPGDLMRALNALLPPDIAIVDVALVGDDFDPRRDALRRIYEYRIVNRPFRSAFEHRRAWVIHGDLDYTAMITAAEKFIGTHDFAAFRSVGSLEKSTVRSVFVSEWERQGDLMVYRVEANSFLRHMVRTMVAAMVEIGRLRMQTQHIDLLFNTRDRRLAPAPAPAAGLHLVKVRYSGDAVSAL